jgi:L-asparaginase
MAEVRRVVVVGTGGTIAMTAAPGGGGVVPALSAADLVAAVPGLAGAGVAVEAVGLRNKPSASLRFDDLAALRESIRDAFAGGACGVVVTQGTDTIEEAAYALDLWHGGPQPLVVTGAMRNPTIAGPDGPANLLAAVTVAASPAARGLGCLVVFADEIHAARRVRKGHTASTAAFDSPAGGPVGLVAEGRVHLLGGPVGRFLVPGPVRDASVALVTATLDEDPAVPAAVAEHADGLVVAGFGVGHVPAGWVPTLAATAARMPVVLASRTGAGPVGSDTYGFPGSERDLLARGLIGAGLLHPYKARVLLRLVLAAGGGTAQAAGAFAAAGGLGDPGRWPW